MATRIQRRRTKGWRLPEGAVIVSRPTFWGNPYKATDRPPLFPAGRAWDRNAAVEAYALACATGYRLRRDPWYAVVRRAMAELEGVDLACWCPLDVWCHADVLLHYANMSEMIDQEVGAWKPMPVSL